MRNTKILVVDDDPNICQLLEQALAPEVAKVITASSKDCLRAFYAERPGLVILDIMMPGVDGFEICRRIREMSSVPIILLSGLVGEDQILRGFSCGADDYITKPFQISILKARIDAVLRRTASADASDHPGYDDGHLTVDLERRLVSVEGEPIKLSPTAYSILALLIMHADRMLTYQEILQHVWGREYRDEVDYVHVYISRLRHKIEPDPSEPRYLVTESRVGYRFEPQKNAVSATRS